MGENGTDFLLLANTGTPSVPTYEVVGCQRDGSVDENNATIDVSCKTSRAQRVLPGRYSSSISLDALYVPSNAAYDALKTALRDGELILVAREWQGVVEETANANVDSLSESYPDQGEAVVSIGLTVDGEWTVVGS